MRLCGIAPTLLAALLALTAPLAAVEPDDAPQPVDHPLVKQVRSLLEEGRVIDALKVTEQQRKASPDDATVRSVYVGLRMSIARQAISAQKFAEAEKLLKQVRDAQPDHKSAPAILAEIEKARTRVPQALADAEQLLRIERFEQAATLLAQVAGLEPDQSARWKEPLLRAAIGAGDDHYMMHSYQAALPFYTRAIELAGGAESQRVDEQLLWRWSHCFAMNLAYTDFVERSSGQWQMIIEDARDKFDAAKANILGQFVAALGRDNMGDDDNAIAGYRAMLGGSAPPAAPGMTSAQTADLLRAKAVEYVDSLNRSGQIKRRGGAWENVLGKKLQRKSQDGRVVVHAENDLAARHVLEAVEYHAPRLVKYFGGRPGDLEWDVPFQVVIEPRFADSAKLAELAVPSYAQITSQGGKLVRHQSVCLQGDPLLLGATVPHELSHVLIHRLAGYAPVPLAIDEGLAIHAETTARYLMFQRTLLESNAPRLTVAQLVSATDLPPVGQRARFYAECYNLVAWLLTRGGPDKVIQMAARTKQLQPLAALLEVYDFTRVADAEKAYLTFLHDQGLLPAKQ